MRTAARALVLGLALAACAMPTPKRPAPAPPPETCDEWAVRSTLEVAKAPPAERFTLALDALGEACDALPSPLRGGAKAAARKPVRGERNQLLDAATRKLLPQACHPWSPSSPALDVVKRCPLDPVLKLDRKTFEAMSGAEYNFLKAVQMSFKESSAYSPDVESLLVDFARAAALQVKP